MARGCRVKRARKLQVWERDGYRCQYCGIGVTAVPSVAPKGILATVDHVIPRSKGGTHKVINLVTSCWNCNMKKADRPEAKPTVWGARQFARYSAIAEELNRNA